MTAGFGMATDFDSPAPRLPVPGAVTGGGRPELTLVDGLVRGEGVLGRFDASPGLVTVKLARPDGPVRVTVDLAADADTAAWWERLVPDHVPRAAHGPRLLVVRSQGRTRRAVLLARKAADFGLRARSAVSFTLTADELPADGFLIVEVADADVAPDRATPRGAVGVRLDRIEVTPAAPEGAADVRPPCTLDAAACARLGLVGTGGTAGHTSAVDVRPGFFVVHPPAGATGPVTWTLRPWLAAAVRPDPPRVPAGPVLPRRGPGQPPLSTREKAVAVARHELTSLRTEARRVVGHAAARGVRRASRPVDRGLAKPVGVELARRDLVRAVVVPVESGAAIPCRVTVTGAGQLAVTCADPPTTPAVVHLDAVTDSGPLAAYAGRRLRWRLVSVSYSDGPRQ